MKRADILIKKSCKCVFITVKCKNKKIEVIIYKDQQKQVIKRINKLKFIRQQTWSKWTTTEQDM